MLNLMVDYFNMTQIMESGQCFRMKELSPGEYFVPSAGRSIHVFQEEERCRFDCTADEFAEYWVPYFDFRTDYYWIADRIDRSDRYLSDAFDHGKGIHVLKQDLWEMMVSFLISQQNNIVRIRRCIENICEKYGEKSVSNRGYEYYSFPTPEALAGLEEDELMACNLGYRSKYVVRLAKSVASGELDLKKFTRMTYPHAKKELMEIYGIGGKVADCICLFALHLLSAFPVDTHIRQALENNYKDGFPFEKYKGFEGVIQQYMFYYELKGAGKKG